MQWVTIWGNAPSIVDNKPEMYAKDITLRSPVLLPFSGTKVRLQFSNFTGTEPVTISSVTIGTGKFPKICDGEITGVTFDGNASVTIQPGTSVYSDETRLDCPADSYLLVSYYLPQFTQMRCGVTTLGPLSVKQFALGNQTGNKELDRNTSKDTNWNYFLTDVELYTEDTNRAIVCYGDSIAAQGWPEYLQLHRMGMHGIVRRAVSGARVLRQYDCMMYESYGIKSKTRFEVEKKAQGADVMIIHQGINDLIHPVGTDVNEFRPMSDLPTAEELEAGLQYLADEAKKEGYKVYIGTLTPVKGWRTYAPFRNELREEVNEWIRSNPHIDGVMDFDELLRDPDDPLRLLPEYDSGDHLHPSDLGARKMAEYVHSVLK
ncbi:MAG: lipase [Erysipelotrichaceae bacterium]|nr:lipase [Erysipelotrichaceae bacterium]